MSGSWLFKKALVVAGLISFMAVSQAAIAVNVSTEQELRNALNNIDIFPDINITADINLTSQLDLPTGNYFIHSNGSKISTYDGSGLSIPSSVRVQNVVINNDTTYILNLNAQGGAIYNSSTSYDINNSGSFKNNSVLDNGGAIYNDNSTFTIENNGDFSGNTADYHGGAIYNANSTATIGNNANFIDNAVYSAGGAIYNDNSTVIIGNDANFTNNIIKGYDGLNSVSDGYGGAVSNVGRSDFTIEGNADFSDNTAYSFGGAVYNYSNSTFTVEGNANFSNNTANANGGAIRNDYSTFTIEGNANFSDNTALDASGGAIYNAYSTFTIGNNANFSNNTANGAVAIQNFFSTFTIEGNADFSNNTTNSDGGAIQNGYSTFTIEGNADFSNNIGGAVRNDSNSKFILNNGGTFINNASASQGWSDFGVAIFNGSNSITTLIANTNNVEFTGNNANGVNNAVHSVSSSVLNLNASDNASVIFNDRITSQGNSNIININATNAIDSTIRIDAPTSGTIYLNEDMSGFKNYPGATGNTVNLYGGTLALGTGGKFFDKVDFNAYEGSTLDLLNQQIDTLYIATANINNMNLKLDVDMLNRLTDNIIAYFSGSTNQIILSEISVFNDINATKTFTIDPQNKFQLLLADSAKVASGLNYSYNVINNFNGTITLSPFATPAPEPSSMLLGFAGLLGCLGRRRLRNKA